MGKLSLWGTRISTLEIDEFCSRANWRLDDRIATSIGTYVLLRDTAQEIVVREPWEWRADEIIASPWL